MLTYANKYRCAQNGTKIKKYLVVLKMHYQSFHDYLKNDFEFVIHFLQPFFKYFFLRWLVFLTQNNTRKILHFSQAQYKKRPVPQHGCRQYCVPSIF